MTSYYGIDLGTSNCALALAHENAAAKPLALTQMVSPQGIAEKALLPTAVYLPPTGEFPDGLPSLPWESESRNWLLGHFARERGSLQPDRLIVSAKSWLCHPHVDRRGAILPFASDAAVEKWSPLEVSRQVLHHIVADARAQYPENRLEAIHTVITVPASFDEVARGLTLDAAREAGLEGITLLEEPQAAFYAWLESQGNEWRQQVQAGDVLLVCDIGGGTADFSLIAVTEEIGELALERIAVGEHLLLGGDNMDLALAHSVMENLAESGTELDNWQFMALIQAVRSAKESLFSDASLSQVPLAIPSRGRSLIASTIRSELTREMLHEIVLDGFLPMVDADAMPQLRRAGGVREAGLPYAADAAISKHLARFLTRAKANIASSPKLAALLGCSSEVDEKKLLLPDAVLFNGGVFNALPLRQRVLDLLSGWAGQPVRALEGAQPDQAVALGAAAYARLRGTGKGLRIKSGTARSYYVGMESAAMAVPGRTPPVKALCVAPQGMEEGSRCSVSDQSFYLYTGESSEFRFFQSEVRAGDTPGILLPNASSLEESALLTVEIPPPPEHESGEEIPVKIEAHVTELGNLELYFVHEASQERWKLEFNVRMQ